MATSPKLNWAYYFQGASRDKRGRLPSTCVHKHVDLQPHVSEPFWYDIIFFSCAECACYVRACKKAKGSRDIP